MKKIPRQIWAIISINRAKHNTELRWLYSATGTVKRHLLRRSSVDSAASGTQLTRTWVWALNIWFEFARNEGNPPWTAPGAAFHRATVWCQTKATALYLVLWPCWYYSALPSGSCGSRAATLKRNHCLITAPGCLRKQSCNQSSRVQGKWILWEAAPLSWLLLLLMIL